MRVQRVDDGVLQFNLEAGRACKLLLGVVGCLLLQRSGFGHFAENGSIHVTQLVLFAGFRAEEVVELGNEFAQVYRWRFLNPL